MTPAEPQMSGEKDNPDDLIAELTKLMAADSRSPAGGGAPAGEPRIPGQPTIRIPGAGQPIGTADATSGKFDFARPPQPAPVPPPEPLSNWQDRLGARSNPPPDPLGAFSAGTPAPRPGSSRHPGLARPAIAPGEAEAPASRAGSFDFDFGFNRDRWPPQPAPDTATRAPAGRRGVSGKRRCSARPPNPRRPAIQSPS